MLPVGATVSAAQTYTKGKGEDIRAQVELDRSAYSAGGTARVRLTLINTSDRGIMITTAGPAEMVRLVIRRQGTLVEPTGPVAQSAGLTPSAEIRPDTPWHLNDGEWMPLTDWGYDLKEPGEYTIEAIPQITGHQVVADTKTIRSNKARFTIKE